MANMSYVRFQNTLEDLRDCHAALNDIGYNLELIESDEEREAAENLLNYCEMITNEE